MFHHIRLTQARALHMQVLPARCRENFRPSKWLPSSTSGPNGTCSKSDESPLKTSGKGKLSHPGSTWVTPGFSVKNLRMSKGGTTYPLFIALGFFAWFPTHFIRGYIPFWGEGYEHQQAFWVHLSKGYVKGVCTSTPGIRMQISPKV